MKTDTIFQIGGCAGSFVSPSESRSYFDPKAEGQVKRESFSRAKFGSRTTSFFLRHKDTFFVIDHGLGVENVASFIFSMLAKEPAKERVIHCIQTHFHEDHLTGMRANNLLFRKDLILRFYSPDLSSYREPESGVDPSAPVMADVLADCFRERYWPVTLDTLKTIGARQEHVVYRPTQTLSIDGINVHTMPVEHPGGCCGLRFELPGAGSVVIATDYEPPESPDGDIVEFFCGAKLLIGDMQYRDSEYMGERPIGAVAMPRIGWGHGTPERLLPTIVNCNKHPERVLISHHDPKRSDDELQIYQDESSERLTRMNTGTAIDYHFAKDGDVFWL